MTLFKSIKHKLHHISSYWHYLCLLLLGIAIIFLSGFYPIVRFPKEQIDIDVYPNHIFVKGTYVYYNPFPFPVIQGYTIPFPVDSDHPEPTLLSVKILSPEEKNIPVRYIYGKYRFDLQFWAKEEVVVLVEYEQYAPKKDASYILTTTQSWKRPLSEGIYRLFPKSVKITSSNYILEMNGSGEHFFKHQQFMPQQDWRFSWEVL